MLKAWARIITTPVILTLILLVMQVDHMPGLSSSPKFTLHQVSLNPAYAQSPDPDSAVRTTHIVGNTRLEPAESFAAP